MKTMLAAASGSDAVYDISSRRQRWPHSPPHAEDGFPGERVACFFEDREGNWWAGLDTGGLVRLRERTFETVAAGDGNFAKAAKTVCEDQRHRIGTLNGGGCAGVHGSVTNISLPGDAASSFIFCVCPDASGRLWASAGDEDLFVRHQDEFERVIPAVHAVKSILADHTGRVWVGTKGTAVQLRKGLK